MNTERFFRAVMEEACSGITGTTINICCVGVGFTIEIYYPTPTPRMCAFYAHTTIITPLNVYDKEINLKDPNSIKQLREIIIRRWEVCLKATSSGLKATRHGRPFK